MKRLTALLLLTLTVATATAQDLKASDVSPASRRYREYRTEATEPTFGLAKVKALVKGIEPDKENNEPLPQAAFDRLTTREKFTYCMVHGEETSQNCDMMPWFVDEEHKVFAYPMGIFADEAAWSERQRDFLHHHRTEMIQLLRKTMREKRRVGVNLKAAIVELHANELIPDLIKIYDRDHRDQDILTVTMLLMKDGKYAPFLSSATYRKLYGKEANYQSFIVANEANQKLMFQRAMAFYHTRVR